MGQKRASIKRDGIPRVSAGSHLIQSRVPREHWSVLKKARIDIPQLIRDAVSDAVGHLHKR